MVVNEGSEISPLDFSRVPPQDVSARERLNDALNLKGLQLPKLTSGAKFIERAWDLRSWAARTGANPDTVR
jgi:hypothetical protein